MYFRLFISLTLAGALASCDTAAKKKAAKKPKETAMTDVSNDVNYQAFIGRLRKAVSAHDAPTIASMMTPDFAYVLGASASEDRTGEGVFQYWDEKGLWPELEKVLGQKFAPKGNYMVAPAQFAQDPDYHGSRAGIVMVNGSWKFAYFITD